MLYLSETENTQRNDFQVWIVSVFIVHRFRTRTHCTLTIVAVNSDFAWFVLAHDALATFKTDLLDLVVDGYNFAVVFLCKLAQPHDLRICLHCETNIASVFEGSLIEYPRLPDCTRAETYIMHARITQLLSTSMVDSVVDDVRTHAKASIPDA